MEKSQVNILPLKDGDGNYKLAKLLAIKEEAF